MLILECDKVKKYYGERLILDVDNFKIYSDDRIGIVGLNGAGKTTLLDILSGEAKPDEGVVRAYGKYSYIKQLQNDSKAEVEKQVARKFGLVNKQHQYLSGGEKTRLKIAQKLYNKCEIIFADEPTSNLDISGISLLENELKKFNGALMLISHDREFLDKLCNKILEIEEGKLKLYCGNYTSYREQKEAQISRAAFEYDQYKKEINRLEEAIEEKKHKVKTMKKAPARMGNSEARLHKMGNQKAKANLERTVKNFEARIEHMEVKERPKETQRTIVDINERSNLHSKVVISGRNIKKSFENKIIFENANFDIYNGSRVALIGENGCGKTTLIRMIMKNCSDIKRSSSAKIGYFSQELDILNEELSIMENVMDSSIYDETFVRIVLSRLLFKREDVYKKIKVLSGGERVKVSFAKVFLSDINMLVLDEPTNYLDICSTEAIENALKDYKGTLLFVSHDRRFVNEIADHIMVIENKTISTFIGKYEEYLSRKNFTPAAEENEKEKLKMILENRLSELIGRLSMPSKKDDLEALDREYKKVIKELQTLRG